MIPLIAGAVVLGAWLFAVRRYRRRFRLRYPVARSAAFVAGIAALTAALCPPLDALADGSFAWHMLQHMVLLMLAPPLILLGQPVVLGLAVLPQNAARAAATALRRAPLAWAGSPFFGFIAFVAVLWIAHFSGLYDAAARSETVHAGEHALFLGAALAFWAPVTGVTPFPTPMPFAARVFYVFMAMPPSAFLGFALHEMRVSPYPHYPLAGDIRAGGDIMWMAGGALMFVALMAVAFAWVRCEERYATEGPG